MRHELAWALVRVVALVCSVAIALYFADRRFKFVRHFLDEKRSPLDLALTRIVIFILLIVHYRLSDFLPFARLDPALIVPPKGWALFAAHVPRDPSIVMGTYYLFLGFAVCAVIGLWTRGAAWIAAVIALYLYTIPQLFGKVNHYHHLILFAFLLAAAPCADALSVDALWQVRKNGQPPAPALIPTLRHATALKAMTVIIGLIYFFPGAWKLCRAGGTWFTADSMRWQILTQSAGAGPTRLQLWAGQHPTLLVLGAVFTVVFELGFLVTALNKNSRPFAVAAGLCFHNLTFVLMHISFYILQFSYVALIDWSALVQFFLGKREAARASALPASRNDLRTAAPANALCLAMSSVFVLGLLLAGVGHAVESWPIACYPTFDTAPHWQIPVVSIEAHARGGVVYRDVVSTDEVLGTPYVGRWPAMVAVFTREDMPFSQKRANALVQMWKTGHHHDDIAFADLYVETYDLSSGSQSPVSRRAVGRVTYGEQNP